MSPIGDVFLSLIDFKHRTVLAGLFHIMSLRLPIIISRDTAGLTLSVSEISSDAVSLRNDRVRFFYYGQFNGHDINYLFVAEIIGKTRPYTMPISRGRFISIICLWQRLLVKPALIQCQ